LQKIQNIYVIKKYVHESLSEKILQMSNLLFII